MRKKTDTASVAVPEAEQPYKIPGNWRWVRLGTVCDFVGGGTPSKKNPTYWNGSIPWASVKDVKGSYLTDTIDTITEAGLQNSASNLCDVGDLILITRIEPAKTVIAKIVTAINQDLKIVKSPLSSLFLHYYFRAFQQSFLDMASGSTVLGITIPNVENAAFPLPPLAEQQRIVERIESLFTKLDAAREKAREVVDGFELRKAAILHRAFSGELTEQWRIFHHVCKETWISDKLGNLGTLERGRSKHRPRNDPKLFGGSYPFIQTGDIATARKYIVSHKQNLSEEGLKQSRMFPAGTLCITIAANIGDVAILSYDCCFPDSVVGFTPFDTVIPEFVYYKMCAIQQELEINAPATAQKNINLKVLNSIEVLLPQVEEQREIVRILDDFFEKEQQANDLAEATINQIDAMKRAILGRAFRGELGTNDPSEASPDI